MVGEKTADSISFEEFGAVCYWKDMRGEGIPEARRAGEKSGIELRSTTGGSLNSEGMLVLVASGNARGNRKGRDKGGYFRRTFPVEIPVKQAEVRYLTAEGQRFEGGGQSLNSDQTNSALLNGVKNGEC